MAGIKVYELITNRILEQLDKGIVPWKKPWKTQIPKNLITKKKYKGVNILMLSFTDYGSPYWLTCKQAKDLGGYVKPGEKGIPVVYWNFIKIKDENLEDSEDETEKTIPFLRYYTVFNAQQCENISIPEDKEIDFNQIEECEKTIIAMPEKPYIKYGISKACYIPSMDTIKMPNENSFYSGEEYYSTLFHELIHSTGHIKRLNRKSINDITSFGGEDYSKEELIAEIGASFLCCMSGIENKTFVSIQ